ncbi:unnamed protein product [Arabidopsis lyrata]|uniref:Uncharacterized protein n=2 Tax=Arabidopsis lyrata subsp. lyrata TaxID=81972 RepID=D7LUW6_ARALL|nr:hypothetical protein ARALYDRAFT_485873 [Arabidopsis lyrata subsp. lyrata]CAH8268624.1 unnamed protein product [Arabidopsis lyrata]
MAARANNKYTSINFNHILHKDPPSSSSSSSSSSSASYSSVARSNGRMLVLTKSSPKPLRSPSTSTSTTTTTTTPPISPAPRISNQAISDPDPNQISLRPLGHTGPGSSRSFPIRNPEIDKVPEVPAPAPSSFSPKPDRFVPPHLRPGFVRKDEKPGLDSSRVRDPNLNQRLPNQEQPRQGYFGYGQTGRPKSGGYERIRTDPRTTGNRPGTSGWYVQLFIPVVIII